MFTKLQHDATAIDIGVNSLRSKLPAVMTGYTYNDLDGETVLDERRSLADDTATTLRQFEGRAQRFEDLLTKMVANNAETERQLVTMASEFGLERCLHVTDEVDENDDDANGDEPAAEEKNNDVITKRESEEEDGSGIVHSAQSKHPLHPAAKAYNIIDDNSRRQSVRCVLPCGRSSRDTRIAQSLDVPHP